MKVKFDLLRSKMKVKVRLIASRFPVIFESVLKCPFWQEDHHGSSY